MPSSTPSRVYCGTSPAASSFRSEAVADALHLELPDMNNQDLPKPDFVRNMRLIGHTDQGGRPDGVQLMVDGVAHVGHMFSKGLQRHRRARRAQSDAGDLCSGAPRDPSRRYGLRGLFGPKWRACLRQRQQRRSVYTGASEMKLRTSEVSRIAAFAEACRAAIGEKYVLDAPEDTAAYRSDFRRQHHGCS